MDGIGSLGQFHATLAIPTLLYSRLSCMMATRCSESTMLLRDAPRMTASLERTLTAPGPEEADCSAKEGAVGP